MCIKYAVISIGYLGETTPPSPCERLQKFFGTSENAVKTQIWIAISAYVLVAIMKKRLKIDLSLYTILQILSISLFEKKMIYQVLTETSYRNEITSPDKQLKLFES